MEKDKRISPKTEKVLDRLRVISFAILFLFVCVSSMTSLILAAVTTDVGNSLSITYEPPPVPASDKELSEFEQESSSKENILFDYLDIYTSKIDNTD